MSDVDHDRLYQVAEAQAGYFTASQAIEAGMGRSTLAHHARPGGRFLRTRPGLYRLRHYPTSSFEHVVAAWLPLKQQGAVVSHASALELYELADVVPDVVHVILPRTRHGVRPRPGVQIHSSTNPPRRTEMRVVGGVPTTTPERAITDSMEDGAQPEQIELAIHQALERGLTTPRRLRVAAAAARSARVRDFVEQAAGSAP